MQSNMIPMIAFLWAGMVLGISFLESWVKFRAPSLTRAVGLDVGRTVFNVFHQVQNLLLLVLSCMTYVNSVSLNAWLLLGAIALMLGMQSFWYLPILNKRVDDVIAGNQLASSHMHALYGVAEVLKFVLLLTLGMMLI